MKDHAVLLLKDEKNRFLFVRRSLTKKTLPGIWAFPSGTQEEGESLNETIMREAFEELGVQVIPECTIGTKELTEFGVQLHFIVGTLESGVPFIKDTTEIDEIEWLTLPEFFEKYDDTKIGHGLIFLRQHPEVWEKYC